MWIWIIIIVGVVGADQLTKRLVVEFLSRDESFELIPGIFQLTYVENRGAAFGMLSEHRWVFMVISVIAIVAMLIYLWKFAPKSRWACVALSMIIGGGIGNMIDRVYLNYVIDFLDFCAFPNLWVWVFNVADACVCVGGGILVVWCVVSLIQEMRAEKMAKTKKSGEPLDEEPGADGDS